MLIFVLIVNLDSWPPTITLLVKNPLPIAHPPMSTLEAVKMTTTHVSVPVKKPIFSLMIYVPLPEPTSQLMGVNIMNLVLMNVLNATTPNT
jgi:hypothetical protein